MQRVALIGYGVMGGTHANGYKEMPGAELACVIDVDEEKRKKAEDALGVKTFGSMKEALDAEEFGIVDCCLPTFLHPEGAVEALEAGKHVICEKPMALTVDECQRMIDARDKSGKFLMIAHVLRWWPEYVKLKEVVESGKLGRVRNTMCTRVGGTPMWSWDKWLQDGERSGGALVDLHVHDIDWLCALHGRPKAVFCTASEIDRATGPAHVFANYIYDDLAACAEGAWDQASGFAMACRVTGEEAVVSYSSAQNPTLQLLTSEGAEPIEFDKVSLDGSAAEEGNISDLGGYYAECKYFVDCVESGTTPSVLSAEDAKQNIEIAQAEIESLKTGKVVELP
jgi:predicted dehydrogenase